MIYKNVSIANKHYKPSASIINATSTENASILGRISLSLSLSRLVRFLAVEFLNFSTLFARFSLSASQKFIIFTRKFTNLRHFLVKFKKSTTFIHFYQISTQHDFKILKILKNSTQRTSYGDTKRTRFHR